MTEVRCPGCGFETAPTFEVCPRCHRPLTIVRAPRTALSSSRGGGVIWPIVAVGFALFVGLIVWILALQKHDPGDTRKYATLEAVLDRRIQQVLTDPKVEPHVKDMARRIKVEAAEGKLDRLDALEAFKDVKTSETAAQMNKRLHQEVCARLTAHIEDPALPDEVKDLFIQTRRDIYDVSDEEFAKANSEMENFMSRFND